MFFRLCCCCWAFLGMLCPAFAQQQRAAKKDPYLQHHPAELQAKDTTGRPFYVREIHITGNQRTKSKIIERELTFKRGENFSLQELVQQFEISKNQLINTRLFMDAVISLQGFEGYAVDILIELKERWYIFPVPYFRPVDRNLNQFLVENKGNLNRVNYGLKLVHNNFTGNNDRLYLWAIGGYTQQLQFRYDKPFIDKKLTTGINTGFLFARNREVHAATVDDKQEFFKRDGFIREQMRANIDITHRPGIRYRHVWRAAIASEKLDSSVINRNPDYFGNGKSQVVYPELGYSFEYFFADYLPYPMKGHIGELSILRRGLNADNLGMWQLRARSLWAFPIAKKMSVVLEANGQLKLPFKQPFFNQTNLGYGDFTMRGYEYYLMDGVAGGVLKTSIIREAAKGYLRLPVKKGSSHDRIPYRIMFRAFMDYGYSHNPNPQAQWNNLQNRNLFSGGFGVDVISFYDLILRFNFAFNQLGEQGLFVNTRN